MIGLQDSRSRRPVRTGFPGAGLRYILARWLPYGPSIWFFHVPPLIQRYNSVPKPGKMFNNIASSLFVCAAVVAVVAHPLSARDDGPVAITRQDCKAPLIRKEWLVDSRKYPVTAAYLYQH